MFGAAVDACALVAVTVRKQAGSPESASLSRVTIHRPASVQHPHSNDHLYMGIQYCASAADSLDQLLLFRRDLDGGVSGL